VRAGEPVSAAEEAAAGTSIARQRRLLIMGPTEADGRAGKIESKSLPESG
jgi:hypothetical protein